MCLAKKEVNGRSLILSIFDQRFLFVFQATSGLTENILRGPPPLEVRIIKTNNSVSGFFPSKYYI